MAGKSDLKVVISSRDSSCGECNQDLGGKAWITLDQDKGAVCLSCADLDHLVFLPSGDAALTRRSRKHSTLSAVVLKWRKPRKRYERQGLLVEEQAMEQAEQECLADSEVRKRQRERDAIRRERLDEQYVQDFAIRIRELYPGCPSGREQTIAEHACLKFSGRVGRSSAAREFDEEAVRLAVAAHIRHRETPYDRLLAEGLDRRDARAEVAPDVQRVLASWESEG